MTDLEQARDFILGMAGAVDAGQDPDLARAAALEWLIAPGVDVETQFNRYIGYINASAVLVALFLKVTPDYFRDGFTKGRAYAGVSEEDDFPEPPVSDDLFERLLSLFGGKAEGL